jgi:hypothetical protein
VVLTPEVAVYGVLDKLKLPSAPYTFGDSMFNFGKSFFLIEVS